jgi:hypothetical protein
MKAAWLVMAVLLAMPVLAQEGDFLRAVNGYGPTYHPVMAQDLRLLVPQKVIAPMFGNYSSTEILAAKVTTGEYYAMMVDNFKDMTGPNVTDARTVIMNESRRLCNVSAAPKSQKELDCLQFYGSMGLRMNELWNIPTYDICKFNTQVQLNSINEARVNGNLSDIMAIPTYAVQAMALKWCQENFDVNLTVVEPTANNTVPSHPPPDKSNPPLSQQELVALAQHVNSSANSPTGDAVVDAGARGPSLASIIGYSLLGIVLLIVIVLVVRSRVRHHAKHQQHHDGEHHPEHHSQHDGQPPKSS